MVEEGVVGKLSLITRRKPCHIAADMTRHRLRTASFTHTLNCAAAYHSLFGDEPFYEVTQGVGGVCWCGTMCQFDIFYSIINNVL